MFLYSDISCCLNSCVGVWVGGGGGGWGGGVGQSSGEVGELGVGGGQREEADQGNQEGHHPHVPVQRHQLLPQLLGVENQGSAEGHVSRGFMNSRWVPAAA
jgi:hypothetical protein